MMESAAGSLRGKKTKALVYWVVNHDCVSCVARLMFFVVNQSLGNRGLGGSPLRGGQRGHTTSHCKDWAGSQ